MIKGIIFDLDGVITSTSYQHYLAWKEIANQLQIPINASFENEIRGVSRARGLEILLAKKPELKLTNEEKELWTNKKNAIYQTLITKLSQNDILPNIETFIKTLLKHGFMLALGSISVNAQYIIDKLQLGSYFSYIVDPTKIKHLKPAPDIFLAAAKGLHLLPEQCLVIEDAESGIAAAKQARIKTIGINVKADITIKSTTELNLALINKISGRIKNEN